MPQNVVTGTLVALVGRPYKEFTNSQGDKMPAGTSWRAWLVESFDHAPFSVKVNGEQATELDHAGFGAQVEATCWLRAKGDRIEHEVAKDGLKVVALTGAE